MWEFTVAAKGECLSDDAGCRYQGAGLNRYKCTWYPPVSTSRANPKPAPGRKAAGESRSRVGAKIASIGPKRFAAPGAGPRVGYTEK